MASRKVIPNPSPRQARALENAINIWMKEDNLTAILETDYEQGKLWDDLVRTIRSEAETLPMEDSTVVASLITAIGGEIRCWLTYLQYFLRFSPVFYIEYLSELEWTIYGTIDEYKMAKKMVDDERIEDNKRFEIACNHFLEEDIVSLKHVKANDRNSGYINQILTAGGPLDRPTTFWTTKLHENELPMKFRVEESPLFERWFRHHFIFGYVFAMKYFWKRMRPERNYQCIEWLMYASRRLIVRNGMKLIAFLTWLPVQKSLREFCNRHPTLLMLRFMDWPLQDLFSVGADILRDNLTNYSYHLDMLSKVTKRYPKALKTYWTEARVGARIYFLTQWLEEADEAKEYGACSTREEKFVLKKILLKFECLKPKGYEILANQEGMKMFHMLILGRKSLLIRVYLEICLDCPITPIGFLEEIRAWSTDIVTSQKHSAKFNDDDMKYLGEFTGTIFFGKQRSSQTRSYRTPVFNIVTKLCADNADLEAGLDNSGSASDDDLPKLEAESDTERDADSPMEIDDHSSPDYDSDATTVLNRPQGLNSDSDTGDDDLQRIDVVSDTETELYNPQGLNSDSERADDELQSDTETEPHHSQDLKRDSETADDDLQRIDVESDTETELYPPQCLNSDSERADDDVQSDKETEPQQPQDLKRDSETADDDLQRIDVESDTETEPHHRQDLKRDSGTADDDLQRIDVESETETELYLPQGLNSDSETAQDDLQRIDDEFEAELCDLKLIDPTSKMKLDDDLQSLEADSVSELGDRKDFHPDPETNPNDLRCIDADPQIERDDLEHIEREDLQRLDSDSETDPSDLRRINTNSQKERDDLHRLDADSATDPCDGDSETKFEDLQRFREYLDTKLQNLHRLENYLKTEGENLQRLGAIAESEGENLLRLGAKSKTEGENSQPLENYLKAEGENIQRLGAITESEGENLQRLGAKSETKSDQRLTRDYETEQDNMRRINDELENEQSDLRRINYNLKTALYNIKRIVPDSHMEQDDLQHLEANSDIEGDDLKRLDADSVKERDGPPLTDADSKMKSYNLQRLETAWYTDPYDADTDTDPNLETESEDLPRLGANLQTEHDSNASLECQEVPQKDKDEV